MIETWQEMTDRHAMEKAEALAALAEKRLTQSEAARVMGMTRQCLNNFVRRNDIFWPVIEQGKETKDANILSKLNEGIT